MTETIEIRLVTPPPAILLRATALGALLACASLLFAAAQTPAPAKAPHAASASKPAGHSAAKNAHRKSSSTPAVAAQPAVAPATPPAPPAPNWPANQEPKPANITLDSRGLVIEASNSSLNQILKEVATDTGARLAGLGKDQRIFGVYGPGPAREVLSKLLDGTGYNVLLTGGQGAAPLTQIVLSTTGQAGQQPQAKAHPASEDDADDDDQQAEEPEQPQQPQPVAQPQQPPPSPIRNPFANGMRVGFPPSDPQQAPANNRVSPP